MKEEVKTKLRETWKRKRVDNNQVTSSFTKKPKTDQHTNLKRQKKKNKKIPKNLPYMEKKSQFETQTESRPKQILEYAISQLPEVGSKIK